MAANAYEPLPTVSTTPLPSAAAAPAVMPGTAPGRNAPATHTGVPPSVTVAAAGPTPRVGTRTVAAPPAGTVTVIEYSGAAQPAPVSATDSALGSP
jgi:hypothetical protein